jgi:tRNA(adenine34) deaminase|tara:strand:+ start:103 stop:576 length:474 start_codon:yes stop_codon:yes gene_type:complete
MEPSGASNSSAESCFMEEALEQAKIAYDLQEVPIGAVVVKDNKVIGRGHNTVISHNSVLCHAELNAIKDASATIKNYRLTHCDLYVSVEPCHMCCMAIVHARISNLYFATNQPKTGAVISIDNFFDHPSHNHKVKCNNNFDPAESKQLIKAFFKARR